MKDIILELKGVSISNLDYLILDNVSCKIKKNSFTVILGESGTGKSTLLKVMAGIIPPDRGIALINNEDSQRVRDKRLLEIKSKIGFTFQDAALISNLTIKENLMLPLDLHFKTMTKPEKDKRIENLLIDLGMLDSINERPAQLSIGEKKIISFARAIIARPQILFLDNPLTFIDPLLAKRMIKGIKAYSDQEWTTVIMSSYSKDIIRYNACHLILIKDKKIVLHDEISKIFSQNPENFPDILRNYF